MPLWPINVQRLFLCLTCLSSFFILFLFKQDSKPLVSSRWCDVAAAPARHDNTQRYTNVRESETVRVREAAACGWPRVRPSLLPHLRSVISPSAFCRESSSLSSPHLFCKLLPPRLAQGGAMHRRVSNRLKAYGPLCVWLRTRVHLVRLLCKLK